MNREIIEVARKICWEKGFNPDQLVTRFFPKKDSQFIKMNVAPVDIAKIIPMFMLFYDEAKDFKEKQREREEKMTWEYQ